MKISESLLLYTAENSNYQLSRDYVSMSHASLTFEEIINQFRDGFPDSLETRLRCYKGYQLERDLMERLKNVFGNRVTTGIEYSAFDGMVKGHPDFCFDGFPADCKSVLMDDWLPKDGKISRKIYWQMQSYMMYGNKEKALVIFESRESGKLEDYWIRANKNIQTEINAKFSQVCKFLKSI